MSRCVSPVFSKRHVKSKRKARSRIFYVSLCLFVHMHIQNCTSSKPRLDDILLYFFLFFYSVSVLISLTFIDYCVCSVNTYDIYIYVCIRAYSSLKVHSKYSNAYHGRIYIYYVLYKIYFEISKLRDYYSIMLVKFKTNLKIYV